MSQQEQEDNKSDETTKYDPQSFCHTFSNCKECVPRHKGHNMCFWCSEDNSCISASEVKDHSCGIKTLYGGNCHVPMTGTASAFLFLFFMFVGCACFGWCKMTRSCCYNKNPNLARIQMEEAKFEQERQERREANEVRKQDRRKRMDVIRQKYGLAPKNPYQVMDDSPL